MHKLQTEILVIGGGATGTGLLRDLAMRGFKTILVEKRDLTHGTTGRFHGLLHSGGRYAVKDPAAARECIEENRILRKIMPHCIEDTGGYFVQTPGDDLAYADRFVSGCRAAKIPIEEVPIRQMLAREPHLNPEITRCFWVPDGAADGFAAAHANVAAAREDGAQFLTYHEVLQLLTENGKPETDLNRPPSITPGRVVGALCHDLVRDEAVEIHADLVINAAGAWAGKIGATVGIEIAIRPGKGTMLAVSHRIVNTVINRLKMPGDGDILVPAHTVAVMGTTDRQVPDPDRFAIEPWEIQLMLTEGEKIIPGFSQLRMLRAWAGVRPLYQETRTDQSRDITRSFVLLDHEERDGVTGLLTITSGKWTTYRKMAEITADKACQKLGTRRECRTHLEELPSPERAAHTAHRTSHTLGHRLALIERDKAYGQLICECELATRADIEHAIIAGEAKTLDDIRRDARLGMGPCQGGFCTLRAAGVMHHLAESKGRRPSISDLNAALRDFLQERWKGVLPVLWGQQLRQERLNELIYLNVLNIDHLPGESASRLGPENYLPSEKRSQAEDQQAQTIARHPHTEVSLPPLPSHLPLPTIILGAGLAGLTAAWQLAHRGQKVKVLAKGWGATHWGSGCLDVLGYYPLGSRQPIESPVSALARLALEQPSHPYALFSFQQIDFALKAFQQLCADAEYPMQGSLERNWLLPTAAGAARPTCLAPETFVAGNLREAAPMLLVGFEGYHDFYPHLAAANLRAQGFEAQAVMLELPSLRARKRVDTMVLARLFDEPDFVAEVAERLAPHLGDTERIGFPALLGLRDSLRVVRGLESILGRRVFEIPGLPPSVPGMRLHQILTDAIQKAGGQIYPGLEAISSQKSKDGRRIEAINSESAARPLPHRARNFILATGGILGGGICTDPSGATFEPIFELPIEAPANPSDWLQRAFLHPQGHSIFDAGLRVNARFCTEFENVFVIGGALAGDFVRERSLEGVALTTGFAVAEELA